MRLATVGHRNPEGHNWKETLFRKTGNKGGRPLGPLQRPVYNIRLSSAMREQLNALIEQEQRPASDIIRQAVDEYHARHRIYEYAARQTTGGAPAERSDA